LKSKSSKAIALSIPINAAKDIEDLIDNINPRTSDMDVLIDEIVDLEK